MPPEEKRQTLSQQQDELLLLAETLGEVKDRLARIEGEYTAQTAPLDAAKATQDSALVALNAALEGIKQLNFHVLENNLGEVSKRIEAVSRSAEEAIGQLHNKLDNEALLRGEAIVALDQKLSRAESTRAEFTKQQTEQHQNFGKVFAEIRQTIDQTREELAANLQKAVTQFAEPAGLNPRGKWDAQATYARLDLVSLNGSSYVSMVDGNRDKPSRNSKTWGLIASRGGSALGGGATDITGVAGIGATGLLLVQSGTAQEAREILGVNDFTGATSSEDGTAGRVIKPSAGDQTKYLRGDGTWTTPSTVTAPAASQSEVNAGTEDAKYVSPLTNEVRTLAGDTPRQVANMLLSDGTAEYLQWTPGTPGDFSVTGFTAVHVFVVPTLPSSGYLELGGTSPTSGTLNDAGSCWLGLDSSGNLSVLRGTATDYRRKTSSTTLTPGDMVSVVWSWAPDGTVTLRLNGVNQSLTDGSAGSPAAWGDALTTTYLLTGRASGRVFRTRPGQFGIGAWTDAEALRHAQTGLEPDWWVSQTGSAVAAYETDFSTDAGWSFSNGSASISGGQLLFDDVNDVSASRSISGLTRGQKILFRVNSDSAANVLLRNASGAAWCEEYGINDLLALSAGDNEIVLTVAAGGETSFGFRFTTAFTGSEAFNSLSITPLGPIITPAMNPHDRVAADLGANNITGLLSSGMSIVGNNREHDEPIKLTVSHSGAGNLQFGGQDILTTLRANAIESIIVTSDAAVTWSLGSSDGGEQYVSDLSLSAAEQYVAPSDIVTYLLTGGALWSKSDGAAAITLSIKTRSR